MQGLQQRVVAWGVAQAVGSRVRVCWRVPFVAVLASPVLVHAPLEHPPAERWRHQHPTVHHQARHHLSLLPLPLPLPRLPPPLPFALLFPPRFLLYWGSP